MKPLVSVYCEGTEVKLALLSNEKGSIKILNVLSVSSTEASRTGSSLPTEADEFSMEEMGSELSLDEDSSISSSSSSNVDSSDFGTISTLFTDLKLGQTEFLPIVTDPTINYHIYEGSLEKDKSKQIEAIVNEIRESKGTIVQKDHIDCIDFNANSKLAVFIEGNIPCVDMLNSLAEYNGKRYFKIPTIKSAEISLAYYVSKTTKFFPEDYSLIIYTGKEYSKLIFLEGQNIKHIGSTLDIGTKNLQTYDVYFSKILLEMENGGIPRLDNVVLCGEDNSENLILSFYGTFPEANVSELKFDLINQDSLPEDDREIISSFAIPIAGAIDYWDQQNKIHTGIDILPDYIKENQKFLQFGWHSYAMLPVLFAVTFFFTFQILSNVKEIEELDLEVARLKNLESQNQMIINQMGPLSNKIANFDNTQGILDSAAVGTEIYWQMLEKVSDFIERRRNFWITKMGSTPENTINVTGYSLSRSVLTEFADYNNSSLLRSILYDPLKEQNAFQFVLGFNLENDSADVNGP